MKENRDDFKIKIINILKLKKYYICMIVFLKIVLTIIGLIMPIAMGRFLDVVIIANTIKELKFILLLILVCIVITISVEWILGIILSIVHLKSMNDVLKEVYNKLFTCKYKNINNLEPAYLTRRVTQDINIIIDFFYNNIIEIIMNLISLLLIIFLIFKLNYLIGIILVIGFVLNIVIYLMNNKKLYELNYKSKEGQNEYFSVLFENINLILFSKINNLLKNMEIRLENTFNKYFFNSFKYIKKIAMYDFIQKIPNKMISLIIFILGGYLIINKKITVGDFTLINSYSISCLGLSDFFVGISKSIQDFKVSFNRINDIFLLEDESKGDVILEDITSVKLKNIDFKYNDNVLFKDVSMSFEKGKIYGILGSNGTGKSSLIKLLLCIEQIDNGNILFNNTDISNIDKNILRESLISVSEQDPIIFNENLEENIMITNNDYQNLELYLDKFKLKIKESTNKLSGGEKKKLSIIRSILKKNEVLILDEPTNALDTMMIKELREYILSIKNTKIIIIITHSDELNDLFDKVYNLNEFIK